MEEAMKILLPIDGSKCSEAAVREVAARTFPPDSEVRLVYALEMYPRNLHGAGVLPPERYEDLENLDRARSRNFLDEATGVLRRAGFRDGQITTVVAVGSPKRIIIDEAENWGADLVVVGSHGDGAIKRFLLGSVSLAVAMHAPCSVMIVRSKEQ
jgi:nucleotide-binding universal stress UspA family protein